MLCHTGHSLLIPAVAPRLVGEDRGPIEIDFEAATPAIDGYDAAQRNEAYADRTEHWGGAHYETRKWHFAEYVSEQVAATYPLDELTEDDVESFSTLFEGVNRLLTRTSLDEVVNECRRCGTTVEKSTETCPACGADAIVQHRIS